MSELAQAIEEMRNMRESYDAQATAMQSLAADVQSIKDAHILEFNTSGVVWTHPEAISPLSLLIYKNTITHLVDNSIEILNQTNGANLGLNSLEYLEMKKLNRYDYNTNSPVGLFEALRAEIVHLPSLIGVYSSFFFINNSYIKELYLDEYNNDPNDPYQLVKNCAKLRVLYMPKANNIKTNGNAFSACPNLIDVTCGAYFTSNNIVLQYWSPSNALLDDSVSLLTDDDIAAGFTSNRQKLLWNIRNHIAANLPTNIGNKSIKFSSEVKAAILADQETMDAFPSNWTIV